MRRRFVRGAAALAGGWLLAMSGWAQSPSMPDGSTPGWVPPAYVPPAPPEAGKAAPGRAGRAGGIGTMALGAPILYPNTSMTQCPAGQILSYFYYYSDIPTYRGGDWCGPAHATMAANNALASEAMRRPYQVTECVPGDYWKYTHAIRNAQGVQTGVAGGTTKYAGINMVCRPGDRVVTLSTQSSVPASGTAPVTVTVYQNGVPAAGHTVNVSVALATATGLVGSAPACSGTTNGAGQVPCAYVAPPAKTINQLTASCTGCDNTAAAVVDVYAELSCRAQQYGASTTKPIFPATGTKLTIETDYEGFGPHALTLVRTYRSDWVTGGSRVRGQQATMGAGWMHNHEVRFLRDGAEIKIMQPDGSATVFRQQGPGWVALDSEDTLTSSFYWVYKRASDGSTWNFEADGRIITMTTRNGWLTTYGYSGRLSQVINHFGKALVFTYNTADQLIAVTAPGNQVIAFGYDGAGRLSTATYPGGAVRTYHYEDAVFPQALTGITDENGIRLATITYDGQGRATSSQYPGGADTYSVAYAAPGSATITDPLGTQRTFNYATAQGNLAVTGATLPSPVGRGDAFTRTTNAAGLVDTETDYLGTTKQYTWDAARRLPVSVTEAANRTEARTISSMWHGTFKLPLLVTEPGRTTAYTYDTYGNKTSESVSDGSQTRTWAWTYDASQLMTASSEPNGATTTYGYDASKNLTSITNPLGHVTTMGYDAIGRVTGITLPTGLTTTFTYDSRNRVLTSTRGGLVTTYTYRPSGQVAGVSLPSGHSVTFAYDNAQRLTGWSDNRSAQAVYTLDAMGNRTVEQVKDGLGNTVWQLARTINNINRVTAETLGVNQGVTYGYDANGDLTSETNGLSQSTSYTLDGHKRVTALTNAASASAQIAYNALDGVTGASDFKGSATGYTRNAFGEATQETSVDAGARATQYNALGLPTQVTDALNQATTITRDVLGRPTLLTFADSKTTILRYDLTGANYNAAGAPNASKGYLSEIEDRAGITRWQRDLHGRITQKVQTLANGATHTTAYTYNAQGLLDTITYPAGGVLGHAYSAAGQLTGLTWNASALVSNITWNAMGQPTGWTWAFNSAAASRTYDTAGRVTATEFSGYTYDAAGRITSLTQSLGAPADSNPLSSSVTFVNRSFTVTYDSVGRITGFGDGTDSTTFTYDANGNRLTSTRVEGSTTTVKTYSVMSGGNRLLGYTQQVTSPNGSASTSITYNYNANGEMTADGLSQYGFNAENRLSSVTVGNTQTSPTTRYAHNALGQRVFKTEPLYEDIAEEPGDAGFWASLAAFFSRLWNPATTAAEQLGFAYSYDEEGTLIGEYGSGGAQSTGTSQYIWIPTPSGPMPVVAIVNGAKFAVHSDHLNTPRKLTNEQGQVAWQWKYSAFGDEQPTRAANRFVDPEKVPGMGSTSIADVIFNHRYPGQYADKESGLNYNYFRTYDPEDGVYPQPDPIGLDGSWNLYGYAEMNPLIGIDPYGLETIYNMGPVTFVAYPGPPATDYRAEHGAKTGAGHHVHTFLNGREGPRILTSNFQVYPGDEKLCTGQFKDALDKLKEGEKQYLKRAQMQVFNDGKLGPRLQNVRARLILPRLMSNATTRGRE